MSKSNTNKEEVNSPEDALREGEEASASGINRESLDEAIAALTPEEAEIFMRALAHTMRKRRMMLLGNLLALLMMVFGMIFAFFSYSSREPGSFTIWVFLVPFAGAGFFLWFFGRLAKRSGLKTHQALIKDSPFDLSKHTKDKQKKDDDSDPS